MSFVDLCKKSMANTNFVFIFRYLAICHPIKRKLHFGKRRSIACILSIWIFGLITAWCWTFFTQVIPFKYCYCNRSILLDV